MKLPVTKAVFIRLRAAGSMLSSRVWLRIRLAWVAMSNATIATSRTTIEVCPSPPGRGKRGRGPAPHR